MAGKKAEKSAEKSSEKLSEKELEKKIVELAEKNTPLAKIGLILKQEYGVPKAKYEAGKISKVLAKKGIKTFPDELKDLMGKAEKLRGHFNKNHKDNVSKRSLQITEAKIRKLGAYFKRKKQIEPGWVYQPAK